MDKFIALGLPGVGSRLDKIRILKQVSIDKCIAMFGTAHGSRRKFRYLDCKDQRIVALVERYWPLVNSKSSMPTISLLSLEFVMGIVA